MSRTLREFNSCPRVCRIRGVGDPRTGASPYADLAAFDIVARMGG